MDGRAGWQLRECMRGREFETESDISGSSRFAEAERGKGEEEENASWGKEREQLHNYREARTIARNMLTTSHRDEFLLLALSHTSALFLIIFLIPGLATGNISPDANVQFS